MPRSPNAILMMPWPPRRVRDDKYTQCTNGRQQLAETGNSIVGRMCIKCSSWAWFVELSSLDLLRDTRLPEHYIVLYNHYTKPLDNPV